MTSDSLTSLTGESESFSRKSVRKIKSFLKIVLPCIQIILIAGLMCWIVRMFMPSDEGTYQIQDRNSSEPRTIEGNNLTFTARPEVAHVDCARLFQGDKDYAREIAAYRPSISIGSSVVQLCNAIQKKVNSPRNPNTGFPIMYARLVYKDYEFIEEQLITNYAKENVYCYFIDKKAHSNFHDRIRKLAKCLPNVVIPESELEMDSAGHNQNEAHLRCMNATRDRKWEYAILMQNHDMLIKTHEEMTEILKIYGGIYLKMTFNSFSSTVCRCVFSRITDRCISCANDIYAGPCAADRCIASLERNLGKLQLCPKYLTEEERAKCESTDINPWGKGDMQVMLSRAAVEYIFTQINIFPLMKQMNDMGYGVDEQLWGTLQISPEIRFPGGFHSKCLYQQQSITRECSWHGTYYGAAGVWDRFTRFITNSHDNDCPAGFLRNGICILGVEDLPLLASSKKILANKVMPGFDYAVISCVSEMLFNRTRDGPSVDMEFYENINMVRYHRERQRPGFSIENFECEK